MSSNESEIRNPQSAIQNGIAVGHEERDADIRALVLFALSLITTIIVVLFLVKWAFQAFPRPEAEITAPYSARLGGAAEVPPEPRLQVNAPEDLRKMRAQEDEVLNSYGWVDKQKGIIRIPIDRAIDLLGQRGLPPLKPTGK